MQLFMILQENEVTFKHRWLFNRGVHKDRFDKLHYIDTVKHPLELN
jgi:hypothetical protein